MQNLFETDPAAPATPILFVTKTNWDQIRATLPAEAQAFAAANGFSAKAGELLVLPDAAGKLSHVLFGLEATPEKADPFLPGQLPTKLPAGVYRFANAPHDTRLATLAFALGSYRFARYRKAEPYNVRLVAPEGVDIADIERVGRSATLARDLINTPANDMGPAELAEIAENLAHEFGASYRCTIGEDLLRDNFPLIHAVGAASPRAPRLIDFTWGDASHPKVTLVGKGVC
ncbi:MAG: leucyl aminopeptidase family protein, partial [Xanthobacteraceae bacterium]|nr:leucyl aminopeptidase family protein [Xanthobacteraceae bacterium]